MKHTPHNLATRTLTTLALATLLLTGCAQEKTTSAPSPEVSQSTSAGSSVNSSTNSSSNQATSSPTPTPTPSESISYSGGSKAPAGESRPADDLGPAQNVPRPVEPEGMNIESEEGLFKFLGYWNDSINFAIQTGNYSYAEPLLSEEFTNEISILSNISVLHDRGGWVVDGLRTVVLADGMMINQGYGVYTWAGNLVIQDSITHLDGERSVKDNKHTAGMGVYFEAKHIDGKWLMLAVKKIESAEH
ncbi:MAG: DUF6318 family protein [Rothia sp. (in: high G+C Gram-positive bacteria)]|nr:DUF6318 family protein [Rothia sp. (in: high G+C Gram-positive bacteria)]